MVKTPSTQSFVCPSKCNCGRVFKGLKTLSNHFDLCHPREPKPVWIINTWIRSLGKSKSKKVVEHPSGTSYQDFVKAKCAEFRQEGSTLTQRERIQAISKMWQEGKGNDPNPTASPPKGAQKRSEAEALPVAVVATAEPTPQPDIFTTIHINEAADCGLDMELVECCKTLHQGGFSKAFHKLNDASQFQLMSVGDGAVFACKGNTQARMTIQEVQRHMEDTWIELCNVWCDFERSDMYDGSSFDDSADWEDIKNDIVNEDTIISFIM